MSSSVCGAAAGLVATVVTFPLDTSRTVLAASSRRQFRGVVHALRAIVKRGGPAAMYSGLGATLCEILPFSAAEFALYYSINAAASSSSSTATLVNGAMSGTIAGIIARAFVHPIDVVKKRRQLRFAMLPDVGVAGLKSDPPWKTMRAIGPIVSHKHERCHVSIYACMCTCVHMFSRVRKAATLTPVYPARRRCHIRITHTHTHSIGRGLPCVDEGTRSVGCEGRHRERDLFRCV